MDLGTLPQYFIGQLGILLWTIYPVAGKDVDEPTIFE